MHMRHFLITLLLLLACVGCTPSAGTGGPAEPAPSPPKASPLMPELACTVDADCAVKNVGNCCGYFPACVNKDSPVDPDAVRAECARTGTSSVCGFRDIQACECASGQCRAADTPIGTTR